MTDLGTDARPFVAMSPEHVSRSKAAWERRREAGRTGKEHPHPATAEVEYDEETLDFIYAIRNFQQKTGRRFPSWSDVMGVVKALGYERARLPVCDEEPN